MVFITCALVDCDFGLPKLIDLNLNKSIHLKILVSINHDHLV